MGLEIIKCVWAMRCIALMRYTGRNWWSWKRENGRGQISSSSHLLRGAMLSFQASVEKKWPHEYLESGSQDLCWRFLKNEELKYENCLSLPHGIGGFLKMVSAMVQKHFDDFFFNSGGIKATTMLFTSYQVCSYLPESLCITSTWELVVTSIERMFTGEFYISTQ